jgi:exodeoxyribonuclease VII large subunit
MRGRQADDLTHGLRRAMRSLLSARERVCQARRLAIERFDPRRRLGDTRSRLVAGDARLTAAIDRRRHTLDRRLRTAAARLESLSPLAVLGRGYAVCWDATHTRIVRDANAVHEGERVAVTLQQGELDCEVIGRRAG